MSGDRPRSIMHLGRFSMQRSDAAGEYASPSRKLTECERILNALSCNTSVVSSRMGPRCRRVVRTCRTGLYAGSNIAGGYSPITGSYPRFARDYPRVAGSYPRVAGSYPEITRTHETATRRMAAISGIVLAAFRPASPRLPVLTGRAGPVFGLPLVLTPTVAGWVAERQIPGRAR